jgi:hypothetical protein
MLTTDRLTAATRAWYPRPMRGRPTVQRAAWPAAGLTAVALAALCGPSGGHAARSDFVGAETCRDCHESAYQTWSDGPHARADLSLGPEPDRACQACHTTGDAPAGRAYFGGVQCEACHGAGAGYAADDVMRDPTLAAAVGLRDLSTPAARAALCQSCHRAATRLAPFDAEAAWLRIQHR